MENKIRRFNFKSFVSLFLGFSLLFLIVGGCVLYVAPYGRDAYWIDWTFMGLSKEQWLALHVVVGFSFLVFSLWHILNNIRIFLNYFAAKKENFPGHRVELLSSAGLFIFICAGTTLYIPPFSQLLDFGSKMQDSWVEESKRAPFAHAEMMKPRELADNLSIDYEKVIKKADEQKISIEPEKSIKANASANGISPAELYHAIFGDIRKEKRKNKKNH